METDYYKGVVAKLLDGLYLFIERDSLDPCNGIPITDFKNIYRHLRKSQLQSVKVWLYDGSELLELEEVLENRPYFEDVFIKLKDADLITMSDAGGQEIKIQKIIEEESFVDVFKELMEQFEYESTD